MIVASRMNWAALTPSRCASCSTSVQRESAKRTVVARIGMVAVPYHRRALPISPWSINRPAADKRYRLGYICAKDDERSDLRGDLRPARPGGASRRLRRPARRDARRGHRPGGLRARLARLGLRSSGAARSAPTCGCSPAAARSTSGAGPGRPNGSRSASRPRPARRSPAPTRPSRARTRDGARLARAAVRRLPHEQRQAIGLAYWGGLSAHEVAGHEGIPLGTAKSRVRLGLAKLSRDPELVAA